MTSHTLKYTLTAILIGYLMLNLIAAAVSDRIIFVPQNPGYTHLPNEIRIPTANHQTINAVFLEHPQAHYTILFSHGNAEDMSNVVPFMTQFHRLGYSVLMYDYRGYGSSDGTPSTRKAKQDIEAAYNWLTQHKGIPPERIIAQGRSLGGGPSCWLAANHPIGGLVLESTFVSTFRVKTIWPLLPWDKFNSLQSIKKINCPVLIMHGDNDSIIPIWHGKKLYEAAPEPKMNLWIENGTHNDYAYAAGDAYLNTFQTFMHATVNSSAHQQPITPQTRQNN